MTTLTQPTTDELLVEQRGHIALITLNRPERLNGITVKMLAALSRQLIACQRDPEIRVIVLTGAGRGFCSGLDLVDQQARISGGDDGPSPTPAGYSLFDLHNDPVLDINDEQLCLRREFAPLE